MEDDGHLMGETEPLSMAVSEAAAVDLTGEDKAEVNRVGFGADTASAGGLTVDKLDIVFTEGVVAIEDSTDLNGKLELYIFTVDLGESGGVIEMADRSSMEPTCAAGEALEESVAARALTEVGSVPVLMGEGMRLAETGMGYCPCCTTVLIGDAIVLYDRIGEATSQTDLAGDTLEAPSVDLIGDADGIDQTDFNGEADGVVEGELEREPSPHFACPGTVIGAADHAW